MDIGDSVIVASRRRCVTARAVAPLHQDRFAEPLVSGANPVFKARVERELTEATKYGISIHVHSAARDTLDRRSSTASSRALRLPRHMAYPNDRNDQYIKDRAPKARPPRILSAANEGLADPTPIISAPRGDRRTVLMRPRSAGQRLHRSRIDRRSRSVSTMTC